MPQLPTYTAQLGGATPNGGRRASEDLTTGAIAPPDFSSLATGVTKFANAILADKEDSEARSALIASSEVRAKYARELDSAATDGRDLETLKESMTADLAKVGENFQTRRGSEALQLYTANTGLMFDEQANSIEVRRAASVARLEGSKFLNSASAIIQSNPAYLPFAEKDAEAFGDTLRRVSPQQRAEIVNGLKQELNAASAISAARIDPEGTKTRLEKGEWNLNPDQRNTALNKAETEIRAKRAEESYAQAQREREIHKLDDKARDTHFADIIGGKATRRSIMDDVTLLPATREHLINVMETRAKEGLNAEKRSDPMVRRNLWMAINAPEGDPSKVYNGDAIFAAVRNGSLNVTDANQLNSLVAAQKDENGRTIGTRLGGLMSVVGRALSQDPQFIAQPALVAEIQMDYQARVFEKVEQLRKDKKNPSDVFDPTSKDYVGSRAFIQESITTAKTRARGAGAAASVDKGEFLERDGTMFEFMGGDPGNKANWQNRGKSARATERTSGGTIGSGDPTETGSVAWRAEHEARRVPTGNFETLNKEVGGHFGKGNIDLDGRSVYVYDGANKGSYSSLESITIESGGRHILIPKVNDGQMLTAEDAIALYKKTGKYLGKFDTDKAASDYAIKLERRQQAYYESGPGKDILRKAQGK